MQKDIDLLLPADRAPQRTDRQPAGEVDLENWEATLPKFVKVFPHEYKRVLGIPRVPAGVLAAQAGKQSSGQVIRG